MAQVGKDGIFNTEFRRNATSIDPFVCTSVRFENASEHLVFKVCFEGRKMLIACVLIIFMNKC